MAKGRALAAMLMVVCAMASGCLGPTHIPVTATTTTSSTLSPQDQAREILDYHKEFFDVRIPADATNLRVVRPPLEEFRAKGFISFTAPREQVISQTCHNLDYVYPDSHSHLFELFEEEILQYAGVTIDRDQYGYCWQRVRGHDILVLIPRAEGATTYVVTYHEPYH